MSWSVEIYSELPETARAIRQAVFVEEQGFEDEFDAIDAEAAHLVGFVDGKPVCTCRFFRETENSPVFIIGRVAVNKDYRGQQLGSKLLLAAEDFIRVMGGLKNKLAAQVRAKGFYESLGYTAEGAEFDEEGCPHVWMVK
ncbi:GNAT family N-acetyltransferase [Veillonella sp. R32]|uniref:GNAT family N-acetyltransferase n=1 Tax=Veillonella sp. R32 TaxID=2021312 RepID=UPI0013897257|nr:GNAT family N-acetyltransferase [Veillonella sp. R32]KAF1683105.1 GNAT family N-acetyltransferase [Veillonella sp. R32]